MLREHVAEWIDPGETARLQQVLESVGRGETAQREAAQEAHMARIREGIERLKKARLPLLPAPPARSTSAPKPGTGQGRGGGTETGKGHQGRKSGQHRPRRR